MSKISKIAVPGVAEPYDIEAYKALSIPFGQVDSTSTDTAYTAQIDGITSLYDGVCVYLKNGVITSNKNGFTLNVNGLGAKPVYGTLAAATRSGTVFNINYTMLFVYNSSRVSGGCWDIFYGYNSDTNTIAYNVRVGATPPTTSNKLVKYGIAFTKTDGHLLSSNTTGTTATSKALTAIEFDPFAPMYYYPTTAVAANGSPSASYLYQQYSTVDLRYAFNAGSTLVIGKPVYVRCVPQTDGTVKLDGNNCIVQELPTTDDNKVYIYLGYAYGTYQIFLDSNHPVYCIKDGKREIWYGSNGNYALSSHTHPYAPATHTHTWDQITDHPIASTLTPIMDGTATYGTSISYARADHVHPTDTTRAPINSPSFTGTPTAPTPDANANSTQLVTAEWVKNHLPTPSELLPLIASTASIGTSSAYARADHIHPSNKFIINYYEDLDTGECTMTTNYADWAQIDKNNYICELKLTNIDDWMIYTNYTQVIYSMIPIALFYEWIPQVDNNANVIGVCFAYFAFIDLPTQHNTTFKGTFDLALDGHDHSWNEIINPPDFASINSPEFTGIPTAPTPTADNDSTQIANTGWVRDRIDGLGTVFNLKGTKTDAVSLPTVNNTIGDVWYVAAESVGYIWLKDEANHERWEKFGEPIELPATYTPSAHTHSHTDISGLGSLATVNTVSWSSVTNTPATYTPSSHTHTWANISNPPSSYTPSAHTHDYAASSHSHAWSAITNPPSSYTPSAHTHAWANISNPPSSYTPSAHSHAWSEITNTPATYTPSTHTHSDLASINSPQFTGTPTAPSPNSDNNSTAIANTAWVNAAISSALAATDFITAEDLPATYTPSAHTHTWANISNPPASYTPSSHSHAWNEIISPPASYTPSTHTHSEYALINSPQFTGTPTAPDIDVEETPTYSQIATENWVNQKVITVLTITEENIDRETVYTHEPNLSLEELQELALSNRLQLIYNDTIYPFVRYYTWRPGMFGSSHEMFEFSRIQYEQITNIATDIPVTMIVFEYDSTNECFLEPSIMTANLITDLWHDQYTVQDTTLIIGDIPTSEPGGEK